MWKWGKTKKSALKRIFYNSENGDISALRLFDHVCVPHLENLTVNVFRYNLKMGINLAQKIF